MSQVPVGHLLAPAVLDIPKGKSAHPSILRNLGVSIWEEPDTQSLGCKSDYLYDLEGEQSEDHSTSEDEPEEEDLIPSPSLHSLGSKLCSYLPLHWIGASNMEGAEDFGTLRELMPHAQLRMTYQVWIQDQPQSGWMPYRPCIGRTHARFWHCL